MKLSASRVYPWLVAVFAIMAAAAVCFSAVPQRMNFQGRLTDASGNPLTGTYSVQFSIWDSASAGTQLWAETQNVGVSTGIYSVALGDLTSLSTAVFSAADRWLQLKVGADAAMTPRLKLQTVAYAFAAERAGTAGSLEAASGYGVTVATNLVVGTGPGMSTFTATGNLNVPGAVTAGSFVGDGSGLTNVTVTGTGQAVLSSTQSFSGQIRFLNQVTIASSVYIAPGTLDIAGISGATVPPVTMARLFYDSGVAKLKVSQGGAPFYPYDASIAFPDGITNITPVTVQVNAGSGYTVPAGKNFYIMGSSSTVSIFDIWWGVRRHYAHLTIDGAFVTRVSGYAVETEKIGLPIVGPGSVVASTSTAVTIGISGFLVQQTVLPVTAVLNPGTYTVPNGFDLFIRGIASPTEPAGDSDVGWPILIDGINVTGSSWFGLVAGPGQVIGSRKTGSTMTGYLRPK